MKRGLFTIAVGLVLSTLAHAQVNCLSWKKVEGAVSGPAPRIEFCMEYDSLRDRIVLIGGTPYGDIPHPDETTTWEWDGTKWEGKEIPGPPRHSGGSMAFDSNRGVMVLWALGQTWEYDGQTWVLRSTLGPVSSNLDPMCFDSDRKVCVLLTNNMATWEWDGVTWVPRSGLGPNVSERAAMAYDPVRKVCVLNGGWNGSNLNTTWEWNGNSWTLKNSGVAIEGHQMVFSPEHGKVLRYGHTFLGGSASVVYSTWDGTTWTQVPSGNSVPRRLHRMVNTPSGLVLFSGIQYINFGTSSTGRMMRPELVHMVNGNWELLCAKNPGPRVEAALAYHPIENKVFMTGGRGDDTDYHAGVWVFDGTSWELLTSGPFDFFHRAGLAFDSVRQRMVLQTSSVGSAPFTSSTHEWIGGEWVLKTSGVTFNTPNVNVDGIDFDVGLQKVVAVNDPNVHQYDGATWTQLGFYTGACNGSGTGSLAYDGISDTTIIYSCTKLFSWNGSTIEPLAENLPLPSRDLPTFRAFPPLGGVIVFGGNTINSLDDLWFMTNEQTGVTWQEVLAAVGPSARWGMGSTYDSDRGVIVCYGGLNRDSASKETYFPDTWELSTDTGITSHPASLSVQAGHGAEFKVGAFGAQLQYQWRRDGLPIIDGPRISGANTDTLTIDPVVTDDDGDYDVVITSPCGNLTSQSASLGVTCYADCIPDGSLDIFDFFCFGNAFATSQPYADCDGDGQHDIFDFLCFQTSFALGCP